MGSDLTGEGEGEGEGENEGGIGMWDVRWK